MSFMNVLYFVLFFILMFPLPLFLFYFFSRSPVTIIFLLIIFSLSPITIIFVLFLFIPYRSPFTIIIIIVIIIYLFLLGALVPGRRRGKRGRQLLVPKRHKFRRGGTRRAWHRRQPTTHRALAPPSRCDSAAPPSTRPRFVGLGVQLCTVAFFMIPTFIFTLFEELSTGASRA